MRRRTGVRRVSSLVLCLCYYFLLFWGGCLFSAHYFPFSTYITALFGGIYPKSVDYYSLSHDFTVLIDSPILCLPFTVPILISLCSNGSQGCSDRQSESGRYLGLNTIFPGTPSPESPASFFLTWFPSTDIFLLLVVWFLPTSAVNLLIPFSTSGFGLYLDCVAFKTLGLGWTFACFPFVSKNHGGINLFFDRSMGGDVFSFPLPCSLHLSLLFLSFDVCFIGKDGGRKWGKLSRAELEHVVSINFLWANVCGYICWANNRRVTKFFTQKLFRCFFFSFHYSFLSFFCRNDCLLLSFISFICPLLFRCFFVSFSRHLLCIEDQLLLGGGGVLV